MGELFVTVLISGLLFGFVGSLIAKNRGIVQSTGFLLGFFLGPIGLIIVALLNSNVTKPTVSTVFSGERDLSADRYRVWLTQRYDVTRNETLGRYVVGGDSFETLDEALSHADHLESTAEYERGEAAEQRVKNNKRLKYVVAGVVGVLLLFPLGNWVSDYLKKQEAERQAAQEQAMVRSDIEKTLSAVSLPLIPSANTENASNGPLLYNESSRGLCSFQAGTIDLTDLKGSSSWFSSSASPEDVKSFYVDRLKSKGFVPAPQFHGTDNDRVEYANSKNVVFVSSSQSEDDTIVGICVLGRKEMDRQLGVKADYDKKMKKSQDEYEAAQRRLNRLLGQYK